jgi:hypothetical protein
MAVWLKRSLQCAGAQAADVSAIARLRRFTPLRPATGRGRSGTNTKHLIVEATDCTHENARTR